MGSLQDLFEGAVLDVGGEDDGDADQSLRGMLAYSPAAGRLYVAGEDGTLRSADVRQALLMGEWAPEPRAGAAVEVRRLTPEPALELAAAAFCLSRGGGRAALAGAALADPEAPAVAALDLTSRRPAPAAAPPPPPAAGARRRGAEACDAALLDAAGLGARAGLRVLAAAWHPDSERHLAVLASDGVLRLYDAAAPPGAPPEQAWELRPRGGARGLGGGGGAAGGAAAVPVAFAFGEGPGWARFAVYVLAAGGGVSRLCPVVPFGARLPAAAVAPLAEAAAAAGDATTAAWLQRAFAAAPPPGARRSPSPSPGALGGDGGELGGGGGFVHSVPHALEEHAPALVGPLPWVAADGGAAAAVLAGAGDRAAALLLARSGALTLAAVASARGRLAAGVLAGAAAPRWAEAPPQAVAGAGGALVAVRSQAFSRGAAAPAAEAGDAQELLLLDVVDLDLPVAGAPCGGGGGDDDDSDDGGGGAGAAAGRRAALCRDAAAPELLYVTHARAVHAVALPWVPALAGWLAGGAGGLPPALPPPAAERLWPRAGAGRAAAVLDSAPVGDALTGPALAVLLADGRGACLRPGAALLAAAAAAPAADGEGAAAGGAPGADAEAAVQRAYGDVLKGPKPAASAAPAAAAPGDAAGRERALQASIAVLRSGGVEFSHHAHHTLTERAAAVAAEVGRQRRRGAALAAAAAAAGDAAAALDARAARAAALQANLTHRLRLLAELHWALPAPASAAEAAFASRELPEAEAAAAALAAEVRILQARVAALRRGARPSGEAAAEAAAAAAAAAAPPQQLRRVREALGEHGAAIAELAATLDELEAAFGDEPQAL